MQDEEEEQWEEWDADSEHQRTNSEDNASRSSSRNQSRISALGRSPAGQDTELVFSGRRGFHYRRRRDGGGSGRAARRAARVAAEGASRARARGRGDESSRGSAVDDVIDVDEDIDDNAGDVEVLPNEVRQLQREAGVRCDTGAVLDLWFALS